jgi:hypothetical protein
MKGMAFHCKGGSNYNGKSGRVLPNWEMDEPERDNQVRDACDRHLEELWAKSGGDRYL